MKISLSQVQLASYVDHQLGHFFPGGSESIVSYLPQTLERLEYCFSHVRNKYFQDDCQTAFSHLHNDQYAMFLYYLSNTIWRAGGNSHLASRVYGLNKALHAVDLFFEVELPDIFLLVHPIGTVLGRARYSNYLVVYQNCTVGSNLEGSYPHLEEGVVIFGGSMIIGCCHIEENTWIGAGTLVMDREFPPGHMVYGRHPVPGAQPTERNVKEHFFRAGSQKRFSCP